MNISIPDRSVIRQKGIVFKKPTSANLSIYSDKTTVEQLKRREIKPLYLKKNGSKHTNESFLFRPGRTKVKLFLSEMVNFFGHPSATFPPPHFF
jgi:hypothetical protein